MTDKFDKDEDKPTFVTGDRSILKKQKLDPTDEQILNEAANREYGIKIESTEQFMAMAKAAARTKELFDEDFASLTIEQANFVRSLRVDNGYSWRAVARACHEAWKGAWEPSSNQIAGIALCEKAAALLGEAHDKEPWN